MEERILFIKLDPKTEADIICWIKSLPPSTANKTVNENKYFINVDMIKCIAAADSDKVRRILARANLTRTSSEVIDSTSDKETRSIIFLDDNFYCISSVNAGILATRAQSDVSEFIDENKT